MTKSASSSAIVLHEAIAADARPDELDGLVQVEQVSGALKRLGWNVNVLPVQPDIAAAQTQLRRVSAAFVFNLVEALGGNGRFIPLMPAIMESDKIPFTGSGADALYLSSQKLLAKQWMRLHEVLTPAWLTADDLTASGNQDWIVKSVWEHASLGLDDGCIVKDRQSLIHRLAASEARHGGEWFAERFVDGREFNISVIEIDGEPQVLPIAEIAFADFPPGKPRIVGYAAKWDTDTIEYRATPRVFPDLPDELIGKLEQITRRCWKIFGLGGYARVDFRLDRDGVPWVLEINANPCLSRDAGFVAAAAQAGMTYDNVIKHIVESAVRGQDTTLELSA